MNIKEVKINKNLIIGPGRPVFIVAEIGKNFIQEEEVLDPKIYLKRSKKLIRLAKEAGADAVKFQTHQVDDEQADIGVTSPHFKGSDRYKWVKRNTEATPKWFWEELKTYCEETGILFHSTPMSRGSARLLESIGAPLWKVGSGDILDFVTLDFLASTKKPVIFSSGMSTLKETDKAINFLKKRNVPTVLMHCVSKYPCPPEELHLRTIEFYRDRYDVPVGFSDHSVGIESVDYTLAAVALGAMAIEKHFSTSRDLWGSDHKASLTPDEFKIMVTRVRELEKDSKRKKEILESEIVKKGLGKKTKILKRDEEVFRPLFRKTLVALENIPEGEEITVGKVGAMRPQAYLAGLPSEEYESVVGKKTKKSIKKYEPITREILT